ncbi:MAG: DUF411 domain-containing protein [Candidatus Thiodiazotropha sp. (ex Lucinoma borealis)]|nr:DUF411 domain-containing protein [Candidatus Thiodiazotropha sp. (ex Lucinoma borealis)]
MAKKRVEKSSKSPAYGKLTIWLLVGVGLVTGGILLSRQPAGAADVVVYKSPTCGCCKKWIGHLKDNGYTVEVHNQRNMGPVKAELGVPRHLQSCHTAKVGGYVVEGHVPADVIIRLLKEKPQIKGLAVPGMPMGSPGMEGPRNDAYDILTFQQNGKTTVYASR